MTVPGNFEGPFWVFEAIRGASGGHFGGVLELCERKQRQKPTTRKTSTSIHFPIQNYFVVLNRLQFFKTNKVACPSSGIFEGYLEEIWRTFGGILEERCRKFGGR